MKFLSPCKLYLLITSLVFAGGVSTLFGQALAQDGNKVQTVSIIVKDGFRFISSYGIPVHAANNYKSLGIQPKSYAFKVTAKPAHANVQRAVRPEEIFGVSLDGVPIKHAVESLWNDNPDFAVLRRNLDSYGGTVINDTYIYAGVPTGLISKDLTHVGYAADGYPIFVSRENKIETSYRLKEGRREDASVNFPPGTYDGLYLSDYRYVDKAGLLDECNGVKVKNKFYIYLITKDAPHLPLCWKGTPDPTFLEAVVPIQEGDSEDGRSIMPDRSQMRR